MLTGGREVLEDDWPAMGLPVRPTSTHYSATRRADPLRRHRDLLRWEGHMEGAVRSGIGAANEVTAALADQHISMTR